MKFLRSLYLNNRLFIAILIVVALFIASFIMGGWILLLSKGLFFLLLSAVLTDLILLFRIKKAISGYRITPEKLSNGDENELKIHIENFYPFTVDLNVIDEIPHQFQRRDLSFRIRIKPTEKKIIQYHIRPVKRGEYSFGT
ncbi:MAG TPA: DUF58 domain-containing protein, partial [Chryseolinea sp.]|nr:DUF58 domain-containing protein [Chryseolinea sp.]